MVQSRRYRRGHALSQLRSLPTCRVSLIQGLYRDYTTPKRLKATYSTSRSSRPFFCQAAKMWESEALSVRKRTLQHLLSRAYGSFRKSRTTNVKS